MKSLFQLARKKSPSIIFFDDIDAIASHHLSSADALARCFTAELVAQMGVNDPSSYSVFVIAATHTPWMLDSLVISAFERRVEVPLPDLESREGMFPLHIGSTPNTLSSADVHTLARQTEGYVFISLILTIPALPPLHISFSRVILSFSLLSYSGYDILMLVKDALMQPIRILQHTDHFKQIITPDGSLKWSGCSPADPAGKEMHLMDLPPDKLYIPPVTMVYSFFVVPFTLFHFFTQTRSLCIYVCMYVYVYTYI